MKWKNPGVSLLISFAVSFTVLGMALVILQLISHSIERSAHIERANQIFFAAESGMEAAFFHHNARGAGTHFMTSHGSQSLGLDAVNIQVDWLLDGREEVVTGVLDEGQTVEVPLFWDGSTNPTQTPFVTELVDGGDFSFELDNTGISIDFGSAANELVVDWSLSRKNVSGQAQSFFPVQGSGGVCGSGTGYLCEDEFLAQSSTYFPISSTGTFPGKIFPGQANTDLNAFFDSVGGSEYKLSFLSPLKFEDSTTSAKIVGIPYQVSTSSPNVLPDTSYTVTANVTADDFQKSLSVRIPERTAIGAFGYVVFD